MGLAPYGDPSRFRAFFREAVKRLDDGRIRIPLLHLNKDCADRENYGATRRYLQEHLLPGRRPDEEITNCASRRRGSVSGMFLDERCSIFANTPVEPQVADSLALAGGVALNCTANGRLLKSGLFDHVYVQPAAGDDGSAWRRTLAILSKALRCAVHACRSRTWSGGNRSGHRSGSSKRFKIVSRTRFSDLRATCAKRLL